MSHVNQQPLSGALASHCHTQAQRDCTAAGPPGARIEGLMQWSVDVSMQN